MSAHRSFARASVRICISAGLGIALLTCTAGASTPAPGNSSASGRRTVSGLETGVQRLTTGLNLTPVQQSQVRSILWKQHLRIERLWSETSMSAADRVNATRQLNRQTGDLIRAILTEQQRQLYNPPGRDPRSFMKDGRSVEDWIQAAGAQ